MVTPGIDYLVYFKYPSVLIGCVFADFLVNDKQKQGPVESVETVYFPKLLTCAHSGLCFAPVSGIILRFSLPFRIGHSLL